MEKIRLYQLLDLLKKYYSLFKKRYEKVDLTPTFKFFIKYFNCYSNFYYQLNSKKIQAELEQNSDDEKVREAMRYLDFIDFEIEENIRFNLPKEKIQEQLITQENDEHKANLNREKEIIVKTEAINPEKLESIDVAVKNAIGQLIKTNS